LNKAKGLVHVFITLRGFAYPDREGLPHWYPEANALFIRTLKQSLQSSIPFDEIDAHINDKEFIDPVLGTFLSFMKS